jgi:AraC family transcriptional regulator of adaptative response/methylated-DNA-[protein]-cysteine methyltransferase
MQAEWPTTSLQPAAESGRLLKSVWAHPEEVPVMAIGTPFQLAVWESLRRSATASTMTYGEVALTIGRPGAARAVGQAVGANPLAVVIPCHRVVSKGKLTGYRWGLDRKRELLAWELLRRDPLEMPF